MNPAKILSLLVWAAAGAAVAHYFGHYEWQSKQTGMMALVGLFIGAITAR